jgi:Fe-Mn family superoxide dismutase
MKELSRRDWMKFVGSSAVGAAAAALPGAGLAQEGGDTSEYTLPDLPYAVDALEPHLDAKILAIHHDKHHAGYVSGLNSALKGLQDARAQGDYASIQSLSRAVAFHGSGHVLHSLYFANLRPNPAKPSGALLGAINANFGGVEPMVAQLTAATNKVAGSGWGMLAYEPMGRRLIALQIEKHENQMVCGAVPLLVIDVWEHAYYLQYENRRSDYVTAIANVIHWDAVAAKLAQAQKL